MALCAHRADSIVRDGQLVGVVTTAATWNIQGVFDPAPYHVQAERTELVSLLSLGRHVQVDSVRIG